MNENEDNSSQDASYRWLQSLADQRAARSSANQYAITGGLIFALVMSLALYARYFLKYAGGYQPNDVPVFPLILMILGLLAGTIVADIVLWKIGCPKPIRSGIWYGLGIGPVIGIWMIEEGRSLLEAVLAGTVVFGLVFTVIYFVSKRPSHQEH